MKNFSNNFIINDIKNCKDISQALLKTVERVPNKIFIKSNYDNISFINFNKLVNCCCNFFLKNKLKKNDILTIKLRNSLEFLIIYFACLRFKLIVNPIPSSVSDYEFLNKINYLKSKSVFIDRSCKVKKNFFCIDRDFHGNFCKYLTNNYSSEFNFDLNFNPKNTAVLYYSSGTTDNPKIIEYSHYAMIELQKSMIRHNFTTHKTNHLCILPFGHTSVLRYSIKQAVLLGSTITICENFWKIKNNFWKIIKKNKIGFVQLVPSLVTSILSYSINKFSLKNIFCGCSSSYLSKELQKNFEKKFKIKLLNNYGLSEIGASHFESLKKRKIGSIGKPLDNYSCKILNKKNKICKVNQEGELFVKSKCLFNGYYKNKKLTKKSFYKGFFKTGDICFKDREGFYFYKDRKKDLIIKGGVNILPSEIDEAIVKSEKKIIECATVGFKDEFYGEIIKSFVIIKKNQKISIPRLKKKLLYKLGSFKCPDIVVQVNKFPKTQSGKIIKRFLNES